MAVQKSSRFSSTLVSLASRCHVKSIRGQLVLGLTVTLGPCLLFGLIFTNHFVRNRVYALQERRLAAEAEMISYGLAEWGKGISSELVALSYAQAFRNPNITEIQKVFQTISYVDSHRLWRYWSADESPRLLAGYPQVSTELALAAELNQDSRDYFQAARRGLPSYQVVLSKTTGATCLNVAQPVFASLQSHVSRLIPFGSLSSQQAILRQPIHPDVTGVIVVCIPLNDLGKDTGLVNLFKDPRLSLLAGDNNRDFMHDLSGFDSAVVLVSNTGQLLFPDIDWTSDAVPTIHELTDTHLSSLYPVAQRAIRGEEYFTHISSSDNKYLVLTSRVDSAWSLILLLNERRALSDVRFISHLQAFVGLFTLAAVLSLIVIRSRTISRPISIAGEALNRISKGDFDVQLPSASDDEIGGLIRSVQVTADRLKAYLLEVTSFAVTQKQIDTAKSIQQDFLLSSLPSDPAYDAEAFSRPALDIGADWYDMVDAGPFVVFLVADVCDKGVPSALYMSVFRSLIRSHILDGAELLSTSQVQEVLLGTIVKVNDYMASNQNASMMFATLFVCAVEKSTGCVTYVCAGHESPAVLRHSGVELLDSVSGPAIGLFEGALYVAYATTLSPGESLVIYSDGLIDARSPANESWGLDRLRNLLVASPRLAAQDLMSAIVSSVDGHMSGADQFDDLTVMVFRWLGA